MPHLNLRDWDYWMQYVPFKFPESPAPFKEISFQHYEVRTPAGTTEIKSMLSSYELTVLFALAKDYWKGEGAIVDLGCLYGLTTRCLADGLALNESVPEQDKYQRIYAYDLFLNEDYSWWSQQSSTLHAGSWFPEFMKLLRDRLDMIAPCPGDLLKLDWGKEPIEILMVDAAKSWSLNQWVVSKMFPRLIPGRSIVIQQDYVNFAEYWAAITMEFYADRFERLDYVYGGSGIFRCTAPISEAEAARDLQALSPDDKLRLMDGAILRAPVSVGEVLKVGKAHLLLDLGDREKAKAVLATVKINPNRTSQPNDFGGIAEGCIVGFNRLLEQAKPEQPMRYVGS